MDAYHEFTNRDAWLARLATALKPGGRVGVVDFNKAGGGPGPPTDERVDEARLIDEAKVAGLALLRKETFLPFQYFLVFGRADDASGSTDCPDPLAARVRAARRLREQTFTRSASTNGNTPARSAAPSSTERTCASHSTPPAKMTVSPAEHGDDRGEIAPIETARRQPARETRGRWVGHQVAARRAEQPRAALRQRRRRGENRKAGDAGRKVQQLARRAEPRPQQRAHPSSTTTG